MIGMEKLQPTLHFQMNCNLLDIFPGFPNVTVTDNYILHEVFLGILKT